MDTVFGKEQWRAVVAVANKAAKALRTNNRMDGWLGRSGAGAGGCFTGREMYKGILLLLFMDSIWFAFGRCRRVSSSGIESLSN